MNKIVTVEEIKKNEGRFVTMLTVTVGATYSQQTSTEIREIIGFDEDSRMVLLGPSLLLLPDKNLVDCSSYSPSTRAPLRSIDKVLNEFKNVELFELVSRYYREHEYSVNGFVL